MIGVSGWSLFVHGIGVIRLRSYISGELLLGNVIGLCETGCLLVRICVFYLILVGKMRFLLIPIDGFMEMIAVELSI